MPFVTKQLIKPMLVGAILFIIALIFYVYATFNFPTLFSLDNQENYAATRYIAEHQKIPVVESNTKDIQFTTLGTTRSLRPPFTFIVSAITSELTAPILSDQSTRFRLGASVIAALTVVIAFAGFYIAFSHLGLALLGAALIGLLPKFVFLASSNNDDIGAIFSVSLLFTSILALLKYKHKNGVLAALALSFGLVLQTKFTAWLCLPWFALFCLILLKPAWPAVAKRLPLLLLILIAAGGWWVVFNLLNYGIADPTALQHAAEIQAELNELKPNSQGYHSRGIGLSNLLANHDQFLSKSYRSLIGYLEWIELDVGKHYYWFYALVFLIALVAVPIRYISRSIQPRRQEDYLDLLIVALLFTQCAFYLHHNLVRDVQPQARYILPIIMPISYLFLKVIARIPNGVVTLNFAERKFYFPSIAATALLLTCIGLYISTLNNYLKPSYIAKPFFTSITRPKAISIQQTLQTAVRKSLSTEFSESGVALNRLAGGEASLQLDSAFCDRLPLNALITMNVSAMFKGGFYIRIDRDHANAYNSAYWRSFQAGQGIAVFSVNTENCTGVKIVLANTTHQLSLSNLQISELKIHQHGKPF